jgi:hypothetical protein
MSTQAGFDLTTHNSRTIPRWVYDRANLHTYNCGHYNLTLSSAQEYMSGVIPILFAELTFSFSSPVKTCQHFLKQLYLRIFWVKPIWVCMYIGTQMKQAQLITNLPLSRIPWFIKRRHNVGWHIVWWHLKRRHIIGQHIVGQHIVGRHIVWWHLKCQHRYSLATYCRATYCLATYCPVEPLAPGATQTNTHTE